MQVLKQPCDEGVVRAGKSAAPCGPMAERWVLAATILGSSMAFIDGTAVNVALPALQSEPRRHGGRRPVGGRDRMRSSCRPCCWWGARWATASAAGGCSCPASPGFAAASARVRPGARRRHADRRARRAGDRRGTAGAGEPGSARGLLRPGAPRAGDRHLVRLRLDHGRGGAADGRLADRSRLLALGVLPQSPAGRGGDRDLAPLRAGEPGRSGRGGGSTCPARSSPPWASAA